VNKPGGSLSFCGLFGLADAISAALGDGFAGAVVIQGTDTIENTVYVLDLLVASDAPVVVTGAMRNRRWLDRTARRTSWRRSGSRRAVAHG
jgi:L-asparaginase/Glu-tRNA(Gln) amidotransferase subunit D